MKQASVLSLLIVVLTTSPAFGDQDRLLSKRSKGFNDEVAFAVNPHTGDLLATWRRLDRLSEIWVSRAKRKANGKYGKAQGRARLPDHGWEEERDSRRHGDGGGRHPRGSLRRARH